MSYYRQQLEDWLKTIDVKTDRVLDVGGGALPIKGRTKSWEVKDYKILDNEIEKAECNIDFKIDLNNACPELSEKHFTNLIKRLGKYNIVFCLETTEYIFNTAELLMWLQRFGLSGTIYYLSFPFIYPYHKPLKYDSLRYTRAGIENLMKTINFKILELIPRKAKNPELLRKFYIAEGMHVGGDCDVIGWLVKAQKQ